MDGRDLRVLYQLIRLLWVSVWIVLAWLRVWPQNYEMCLQEENLSAVNYEQVPQSGDIIQQLDLLLLIEHNFVNPLRFVVALRRV